MNSNTQVRRDHRFVLGLLTGTVVGAGLAFWFAPRAATEIRERVTGTARDLAPRASARFQQTAACIDDAVDEVTSTGQRVRDEIADAVVRGAHEVQRLATATKTGRGAA